jgi:RNA-directed DNA polymerase
LTALLHHINIDVLRASYFGLKKTAAPGIDEMTWADYVKDLEANLADLHDRVHTGAYRALPSRRTYIPKADGRQRPAATPLRCPSSRAAASRLLRNPSL